MVAIPAVDSVAEVEMEAMAEVGMAADRGGGVRARSKPRAERRREEARRDERRREEARGDESREEANAERRREARGGKNGSHKKIISRVFFNPEFTQLQKRR